MRFALGIILCLTLLHATTLTGKLIDADQFAPIDTAVLKFVGPDYVQLAATGGEYSASLSPGEYTVYAYHYENGTLQSYAKESISVYGEKETVDLVLFSAAFGDVAEEPVLPDETQNNEFLIYVVLAIGALILLFLLTRKRIQAPFQPIRKVELDEDAHAVLDIIQKNEGRMVQKEIREILKWSETKMSLVVAELEVSGHIKRIKKGRENILKIIQR